MALSTKQIGSAAASSVAAATSRVGGGGRNVASSTRPDVERPDFAHQTSFNQEALLRFEQDGALNPDGQRRRDPRDSNASVWNQGNIAFSFDVGTDTNSDATPRVFLTDVMRGVGSYEENMRVTSPSSVKPGSVMNYLF